MSQILPPVLLVAITLLTGWIALWPLRRDLAGLFFVLALPVGLLSWTVVTAVSVTLGGFTALSVAGGTTLFALVVRAVIALTGPRPSPPSTGGPEGRDRTPALLGLVSAAYLGTAALLARLAVTVTTADSWKGYWPLGVMIESGATYTDYLPSARGFVLPSLSAATVFLGGEWEYVIYPLLAGTLLLGMLMVLRRSDLRVLGRASGAIVSLGVAGYLLTDPSFLYHSLYVHSHLMSGAYLFWALAAIRLSFDPATGEASEGARGWLVLAGLSAAGLAMTRPDGLAYVFIPVAVAVSVLSDVRRRPGGTAAFFAPLLAILGISFAGAYLEVGVWEAAKLDGITTAGIYAALALCALTPKLLRGLAERRGWPLRSEQVLLAALVAALILVVTAAILRSEVMGMAVSNARANLFGANGAYALMWPSFAILFAASLLSGDAVRKGRWSTHLFGAIALFFMTAALVHGTSHPGRVGTGDSFSRVAFHIVPTIVWYAAVVTGRVLGDLTRSDGAPDRGPARDR